MREDAVRWVTQRVSQLNIAVQQESPAFQKNVNNIALLSLSEAESEVRLRLWQGFRIWDALNAVAIIVVTIAVCKSIGYVFARIFYTQPALQRVNTRPKTTVPSVNVSEAQAHVQRAPGLYYVRIGAQVGGVATKGPWFPQMSKMIIARFPLRSLFNFFCLGGRDEHAEMGIQHAGRFVEVTLADGESVSFYARYLYAWSATISLSTSWSFRLPNLLRGRISASTATGPGILILASVGPVKVLTAESVGEGHSPTTLMAWSKDLDVIANKKAEVSDIYFGGVVIKPQSGSIAVFDHSRRFIFPGAVRFIPLLLSPF